VNPNHLCGCALCRMEIHLLQQLAEAQNGICRMLLASTPRLAEFPTVPLLLAHLRAARADTRSDEIFTDLLAASTANREFVESFFVLAFLPMIHRTVRKVALQHPFATQDDIVQQALKFLLQFLHSNELQTRRSHFAFSISRAVKRQTFEWARREGAATGNEKMAAEILGGLFADEAFERRAVLSHFLQQCVAKGFLEDEELDLLIQFKLEGNNGRDLSNSAGISSNALRQRIKRLLAKLRRLAKKSGHLR
jgi:DNA-directed RNA polymerase specialized sigma24 family protein